MGQPPTRQGPKGGNGWITIRSMDLHADLKQRVALHSTDLAWTPSPMVGVERRMLDRRGAELARQIIRFIINRCITAAASNRCIS